MRYWQPIILLSVVLLPYICLAERFGWRGDGSGRFANARPVVEWSNEKNVIWKTALPGPSYASPAMTDRHLFVTAEPATLIGLRRDNGEILWKSQHPGTLPENKPMVRNTTCTPVTDGERVYTVFGSGVVSAHSLDGERLWLKEFKARADNYGHSCSPVVSQGVLIVHLNDLIGLSANRGAELWRLELPEQQATPMLVKIGGSELLVHPSGAIINPKDGGVLSKGQFLARHASPIFHEGVLYVHDEGHLTALRLPDQVAEDLLLEELWKTAVTRSGRLFSTTGCFTYLTNTASWTWLRRTMAIICTQSDCRWEVAYGQVRSLLVILSS